MKTYVLEIVRDETLKRRRSWYMLALGLLLVSVLVQQPLLFLASLFTLLIGLVPDLWYFLALRHLVVNQSVNHHNVFFGEDVTLSVSIENQKLLPLPWLRVDNKIIPPLAFVPRRASKLQAVRRDNLSSTWLLWSYQRVTRNYRMRCEERGFHTFGPVTLSSSDPLGWLDSDRVVPATESLLVYPLLAPVDAFNLVSVNPLGENVLPRPLLEDPLRFAGIRDYTLGDDPRRIHWKATAHAGVLKSKLYEPPALRRLLILLDVWNYAEAMKGPDLEIQELTISVAASLAMWGLDEGYMVGLLANCPLVTSYTEQDEAKTRAKEMHQYDAAKIDMHEGSVETVVFTKMQGSSVSVPFASDHKQYELLLSTLASLVPQYSSSMGAVIDKEREMFSGGMTMLLVSAASTLDVGTIEWLLDMRRRGNAIYLILTGNTTLEALPDTSGLPVHLAGGKEKWHELLQGTCDETHDVNSATGISSASLFLD